MSHLSLWLRKISFYLPQDEWLMRRKWTLSSRETRLYNPNFTAVYIKDREKTACIHWTNLHSKLNYKSHIFNSGNRKVSVSGKSCVRPVVKVHKKSIGERLIKRKYCEWYIEKENTELVGEQNKNEWERERDLERKRRKENKIREQTTKGRKLREWELRITWKGKDKERGTHQKRKEKDEK